MRTAFFGIFCAFLGVAAPAMAQERVTLGYGRLFTNDFLGDGQDRWRSGSYAISKVKGPRWTGSLPAGFGDLIEYRVRTEIMAPSNLSNGAPGDRRYTGALSFGVHTRFQPAETEFSLGADIVITGPQTRIGDFQRDIHGLIGATDPSAVLQNQIGDGFYPTFTSEAGRVFRLSDRAMLRPFVELQAGAETLFRAGADVMFGPVGQSDLMLRDVTTGQLYRATREEGSGLSLTLGADIASVADSVYLPGSDGYTLTDTRDRLRMGIHWQGVGGTSAFYGLTWLGREFENQPEGQLVGSLQLNFIF